VRCEGLWVFFDVDRPVDGERLDRLELFFARELVFARAELFLARDDELDDDFVLREPFEDERPRVVASFALARSLATDMFDLRKIRVRPPCRLDLGLPAPGSSQSPQRMFER
jgi:hypothetical protein